MRKRLLDKICVIIALVLVSATGLSSCANISNTGTDSYTEGQDGYVTESCKDQNENETVDVLPLIKNGKSVNIIFSADASMLASSVGAAIFSLCGEFPDMYPDTMEVSDSFALEILIGSTNRKESDYDVSATSKDIHYFVGISGNKLVINASGSYALELAVDYFINECLPDTECSELAFSCEQNKLCIIENFIDARWKLEHIPAYTGNAISMVANSYNAGGLVSEYGVTDASVSFVQRVQNTNLSEFEAYIGSLLKFGFAECERQTIDSNIYVTLERDEERVHTYYLGNKGSVTVIYETGGASVSDISVPELTGDGEIVIYQYGLNMDPASNSVSGAEGYPNNGMLYIVKLADNSLIIIDGGEGRQMSGIDAEDAPHNDLNRFLHEITGGADGEKIVISCWFVTHAHGDHSDAFPAFLAEHTDEYELRALCASIPDFKAAEAGALKMKQIFSLYPDCKEIKLHTGQRFSFGELSMQVLYTHEDALNPAGYSTLAGGDFNGTSTVVKLSTNDMSMLVLGDSTKIGESFLVDTYSDVTLKCDILQVAHHGFNDLPTLYEKVAASIALIPQSYGYFMTPPSSAESTHKAGISGVKQSLSGLIADGRVYFAGNAEQTVGLAYRNGGITVIQ